MCNSALSGGSYGAEIPVNSEHTEKMFLIQRPFKTITAFRTFDLASSCFLIKPLWIALFDNFERCVDENLDEVQTRFFVDPASQCTIGTIG
jgi:hypothetical protein